MDIYICRYRIVIAGRVKVMCGWMRLARVVSIVQQCGSTGCSGDGRGMLVRDTRRHNLEAG